MNPPPNQTFTYSVVKGVPVTLDVYLPLQAGAGDVNVSQASSGSPGATKLPLLVFWHGGGLTVLSKEWVNMWLLKDALEAGFAVISANYSLLSPATGHDILADVLALHEWIAADLNAELASLGSPTVDLERVAVAGASAGAYLAYLSAIHAQPTPRALFTIYGMGGDLLSDQYVHPKTEPWLAEPPFAGHPRTFKPLLTDAAPFHALQASTEPVYAAGGGAILMQRMPYGRWLKETATYLDVITGLEGLSAKLAGVPHAERAAALPAEVRELSPQCHPLTRDAPPLLMMHGAEDTLVLPQESEEMKRRYEEVGAQVELVLLPAKDHAFDMEWRESRDGLEKVVPFLVEHTRKR